jgi:glycosyltransferase involved in cell wall biosynthesis
VLPVLARNYALLYSPANLAPVLCASNVVVIHDVAALRHPEAYSRAYVAYQSHLLPAIARRARSVITVSEFSRGEVVEAFGVPPDRVKVVPAGVDSRFSPGVDPSPAAERYALTRPYVLVVGTVSVRKNLDALEHAARALRERGIDLVVAGSDRRYLRTSQVSLRRLGYVQDELLPALYVGARALAMPSIYEGFGLPCLEAMACGVPVLAASRGALPETVGDAALLADPGDRVGFAQALLTAACEEATRVRLVEAGLRRASSYPWSRTAALTDAVIGQLLGERWSAS